VSSAGRHVLCGENRRTAVGGQGLKDGSAFLTVGSTKPAFTDASENQLDRMRRGKELPGRTSHTVVWFLFFLSL